MLSPENFIDMQMEKCGSQCEQRAPLSLLSLSISTQNQNAVCLQIIHCEWTPRI